MNVCVASLTDATQMLNRVETRTIGCRMTTVIPPSSRSGPMFPDLKRVKVASGAYVKPKDFSPSYGTGGFRAREDVLDSTLFR